MRALRRMFFVTVIAFFFLLGISAADKEYLSGSFVGICILTEDANLSEQLWEFIEQTNFTDVQDLYQYICNHDFGAIVSRSKRFFDSFEPDKGYLPDAVYDTIVIDLGGSNDSEIVYLKQLKPLSHRFGESEYPVIASVQKHYVSFLSLIGKVESVSLDFAANF